MDKNNIDLQEKELQKLFDEVTFCQVKPDELCKIIKYFFLTTSTKN